ncbi:hypothetical protein LSH36_13g01000 [Paralvinella palmiformis]|uniref:EF-hand domain-containing protein n=1 Tax=Paralvinella palmiformis TaxID=53620 RepID=A0AAD9NHL5_9ANNE|nr:hypothetical protein LSH36_13g01000 [Paralvinella palmiformis]
MAEGLPRSSCPQTRSKSRKEFSIFEDKNDGTISVKQAKELSEKVGSPLSESQLQELLKQNELSIESRISYQQYIDLFLKTESELSNDHNRIGELRDKFQRYDVDKNGYISLNEAQWALQMELNISDKTALRLLNQFVKLDYEQFMEFYEKIQQKKVEIYQKFGKFDQDMDSMISPEEAHTILHKEFGFDKERSMAMVNRFDKNKDGLVSYIEFAEFYMAVEERKVSIKGRIRAAFQLFDKEQQGYVTLEQACQILQGYLGFSKAKANDTIQLYDKNKDGKIDYEEFLEFFSMIEEERQYLLTEFTKYDMDKDGQLSYQEFKDMLISKGYSEHEIKTLMAGYDIEDCGYLHFDEFKQFLNFS